MLRTARSAVAGLVAAALIALGAPPATGGNPDFGRMWRSDGVLHSGCHNYKYHYKVKPPHPDWVLETFIVDPRGETIASGGHISDTDPKKGTGKFRFCRYNTKPGTFKLRGKLTYRDGYDQWVRWVKPGFFKLRKAR